MSSILPILFLLRLGASTQAENGIKRAEGNYAGEGEDYCHDTQNQGQGAADDIGEIQHRDNCHDKQAYDAVNVSHVLLHDTKL